MTRKVCVICAGILWGALLAARPAFGQTQTGMLVYNENTEPQTLSPILSQFEVDSRFSDLLFDSLFGIDQFMAPVPHLLEKEDPEEKSPDGLSYTFKLRKGVFWTSNTGQKGELTADDVVFTFRLLKDERTDTDKREIGVIFKDVVAVDRYLVKFILSRPVGEVRNYLFFKVIPKDIFTAEYWTVNDDFGSKLVAGTGPYKFRGWRKNEMLGLERNAEYFKGWSELVDPNASRVNRLMARIQPNDFATVTALLAGGIQLIPLVSPTHYAQLRSNNDTKLLPYNPRTLTFFAYNTTRKPLDSPKVRQALTMAVDRKRMLDQIYGSSGSSEEKVNILSGPFPKGEGDPDISPLPYDPARARQLLAEAGITYEGNTPYYTGENGKNRFALTLKASTPREDMLRICQYFKQNLEEGLGVSVTLDMMPLENYRKEVVYDRKYDVTLVTYSFDPTADIVEELFSKSATGKGRNNITLYTNDEMEALIQQSMSTNEPEMVAANNRKMHAILYRDCPGAWLFSLQSYAAYRIDKLGGVNIHPFNFFTFITDWYLLPEQGF